MKNKIQRITYGIGLLLFLFPVTLFIIATVWLMIGFDINAVLFPFSALIAAVIFYLLLNSEGYKKQKMRAHSNFYWNTPANDWALGFRDNFDIMCESKGKNLASMNFANYGVADGF